VRSVAPDATNRDAVRCRPIQEGDHAMPRMRWLSAALLLAALTAAMPVFQGCENEPAGLSDLDQYFADHPYATDPRLDGENVVHLEPSQGIVATAGQVITFRAFGGTAPYTWDVAIRDVGSVTPSPVTSDTATYRAEEASLNSVIVTDANGHSAVASISQPGSAALSITPSSVTLLRPAAGTVVQFVANGGVPPYGHWNVAFPEVGTVDGNGLYTVVATGVNASNVVSVTDAAGTLAVAAVAEVQEVDNLVSRPAAATLTTNGEIVVFQAAGGAPPYYWTLSYPSRGAILNGANSPTMTYARTTSGDNNIVLRDNAGQAVQIAVTQPAAAQPVISPATAILSTNQASVIFAVNGGTPLFVWSVVSGHGSVSPSVGAQTLYSRGIGDPPGNYVIRVTDATGQSSLATVIQN
jgi:hypothetical protein